MPTSFVELQRAAEGLLPLVESDSDEAETLYHQTDRVVAELRRNGLYSLLTPRSLGGAELPYVEAMELVEMVARADGSAGWCMMVEGVMGASAGAFLPDDGARTIYPDGADVTMAGNGVPRGFARPVDGGYMIKGDWAYGSAIFHAEWIHSGCFVMDGDKMKMTDDGHPIVVLCHHPRDTIELKGNWDVLGLRGTGSYDYSTVDDELFVPAGRCFMFDNPARLRGGIQFDSGLVGMTTWGHTSWALGVGRRVLDELAGLAQERADLFGRLCDSPTFKFSFADAEAKYRAARAFVYSAWTSLCESAARDEPANLEQLALIRLAMRHIHNEISEISTFAHRATRGASLRPSVLQRCYRDIHSGTQHLLLADEIVQECGRVLLGTTSDNAKWTVFGVDG
ncbi:MAG: acyl-CoA dehydrogenase [Rhodospirillales bacterium]|nr:acyl-CoA dehydrogenase [Rhodospirillales bacterium]